MTKTRSILTSAAITGVLFAGGVVAAVPALAAHNSLCKGTETCAYVNYNYVGLLGFLTPGSGLRNFSAGANDQLSSWENLSGTNSRFYYNSTTDPHGLGKCVPMYAHSSATVHPGDGNPDNDKGSSWAADHGCP